MKSESNWFVFLHMLLSGSTLIHKLIPILFCRFKAFDMFTIPLGILFSFVILGNFASKLVDCFNTWFPADLTLESLLEANRGEGEYGAPLQPKLERRHSH
jgi:hypothetical protein